MTAFFKPPKVSPDRRYLGKVKQLPCAVCNAPPPSDAHHCTHRPPEGEPHGYTRLPCAGRKSGDRDAIPLCKAHHQDGPGAIHNGKETWAALHGPDYQFIPTTRAAVAAKDAEVSF